jgi:hypothetical protein
MLKALKMKDWMMRVVTLKDGREALESGGHITSYINPNQSGRFQDRLVDMRLVDDYGVWSLDELSEGELAGYLVEEHMNSQ